MHQPFFYFFFCFKTMAACGHISSTDNKKNHKQHSHSKSHQQCLLSTLEMISVATKGFRMEPMPGRGSGLPDCRFKFRLDIYIINWMSHLAAICSGLIVTAPNASTWTTLHCANAFVLLPGYMTKKNNTLFTRETGTKHPQDGGRGASQITWKYVMDADRRSLNVNTNMSSFPTSPPLEACTFESVPIGERYYGAQQITMLVPRKTYCSPRRASLISTFFGPWFKIFWSASPKLAQTNAAQLFLSSPHIVTNVEKNCPKSNFCSIVSTMDISALNR